METPPPETSAPETSDRSFRDKLFYGRNPGPLLGPWIACVIIVGGVQMFFYNLLPFSIPIILTAIGLIARTDQVVPSAAGRGVARVGASNG